DRPDPWNRIPALLASGRPVSETWSTTEGTLVLQAIVPAPAVGRVITLTADAGDLIEAVRQEREQSFRLFLALLAASLLLSLYLARTIVRPLGELALSAQRVRRGRDREVEIPRYPGRRDEIGRLARALADMTAALRQRIDATEAFAADVAHELKNPLASLRSAVEALGTVRREQDRAQLFQLIEADVRRIDRLLLDISHASRLEAELTRMRLEPVDLGTFVARMSRTMALTAPWKDRVRLETEVPSAGVAIVLAEPGRLQQVLANLLDNAASFTPEGSRIVTRVERAGAEVVLRVEDEGPGVAPALREAIFERFYSERPATESYGRHSGLGLSIVRSIVEAFDGQVSVRDRADGRPGACFEVRLPATDARIGPVDPAPRDMERLDQP
ncbi:MAG: HAMP domain-containing sensor histidine kinase, partial [Sphingomonadaceae bacterium]